MMELDRLPRQWPIFGQHSWVTFGYGALRSEWVKSSNSYRLRTSMTTSDVFKKDEKFWYYTSTTQAPKPELSVSGFFYSKMATVPYSQICLSEFTTSSSTVLFGRVLLPA